MSSFSHAHAHLVIVCEVVAVLDALVAADDVEQLVVGQEAGGHVRPEEAREAARVREPTGLVLESKGDRNIQLFWTQSLPLLLVARALQTRRPFHVVLER